MTNEKTLSDQILDIVDLVGEVPRSDIQGMAQAIEINLAYAKSQAIATIRRIANADGVGNSTLGDITDAIKNI